VKEKEMLAESTFERSLPAASTTPFRRPAGKSNGAGHSLAASLRLLDEQLAPQRRVVRAGDVLYRSGEKFSCLYLLSCGFFKIVNLSADGRERVSSLKFRADWLGLDGIANGHYASDAIAMDTGEVWVIPYEALIVACTRQPRLLRWLHESMSRQITANRESLMSVCTLPADARVADFLRFWVESLADRGLRSDRIALPMSRAEIGDYLGMTLESVSRALSKLARAQLIIFADKSRRDLRIPDVSALSTFVHAAMSQRTLQ
jgi:CRP/FNR family transcriptional regulator, anaerobic regulatory protein